MKGFLQRLVARAGGQGEGLRPLAPHVFEAGEQPVTEEVYAATPSPAVPAAGRAGWQTPASQEPPAGPGASTALAEPPRPHAPRRRGDAGGPARANAGQDAMPPRPLRGAPFREAVTPGLQEDPAPTSRPQPAAGGNRARFDRPASAPDTGRRAPSPVPRSPWSFDTTVPRFVAGREPASAPAARSDRERPEQPPPAPEPVVRVTIGRLDVHAAPPDKARRARPTDVRRDTLADYARKRRESKR